MLLKNVGTIIGTREFDVLDGNKILVQIGKPELVPEGQGIREGYFYCPFQIDGLGDDRVMHSVGVDGLAALSSSIRMIGSIIHSSKPAMEGRLKWKGEVEGDKLGLPNP